MIKKIRSSLTVKICLLIGILLIGASGITYGVIARFLPTYYSNRLKQELDEVSQEMAETISGYEKIEDAFVAVELFETGSQVSVVILDEQGNMVWPQSPGIGTYSAIEDYFMQDVPQEDGEITGSVPEAYYEDVGYTLEAVAEEETESEEDTLTAESVDAVTVIESSHAQAEQEKMVGVLMLDGSSVFRDAAEALEMDNSAVKHYQVSIGEDEYTMIVSGGMQPVNQAMEILYQIFPYILAVSVAVALIFAILASLYLTAPMVKLSRTSQNMAALDFGDRYQGKRTDEIGKLGKNLNELSANLSRALDELHQANEKLREDIEKEREAERKQMEFFSAVSHELKTPITILKGHLSGMLQGIGEYRDRERYLRRSLATAEKMEGMVGELLTVSRIENRAFTTSRTDVAEQLRQQLAEMTELMEERKLEPVVILPDHLYADVHPDMMEKVFRNLLMNAVRYTPAGRGEQIRVTITGAKMQNDREAQEQAHFFCSIENTGVSIPEEALPHLFEAFYRVEQSRNSQTGGSGLGLYIVKMVLEQHGARYGMENTEEGVKAWFLI